MENRVSAADFVSASAGNSGSRLGEFAPFEPTELQVIALARIEARNGGGEPGRIARKLARWFGLPISTGLANPRLEALRRFALRVFRGEGFPPAAELESFLSAGFSALQARALLQRRMPSSAR
jgi:hypothetical protein